jgi:hypothetical protein
MSYETPNAFRMALEQRLLSRSNDTGVALDRLRRRVIFERIVARLQRAEPGRWVLKGGMALEVRLRDNARLTKDIDLGLRDEVLDADELRERLVEALGEDPDGDRFVLTVGPAKTMMEDNSELPTWRVKVEAGLAGKLFGRIQVDVSPRAAELSRTDLVQLPNSLEFAEVITPQVEIIDIHRHAAEKYHAMLKDFGDRENSRVRDLVDLVILDEHELLEPAELASEARNVWEERNGSGPPPLLPDLPESWRLRYERLASELDLGAASFPAAVEIVVALWAEMFPDEET